MILISDILEFLPNLAEHVFNIYVASFKCNSSCLKYISSSIMVEITLRLLCVVTFTVCGV